MNIQPTPLHPALGARFVGEHAAVPEGWEATEALPGFGGRKLICDPRRHRVVVLSGANDAVIDALRGAGHELLAASGGVSVFVGNKSHRAASQLRHREPTATVRVDGRSL